MASSLNIEQQKVLLHELRQSLTDALALANEASKPVELDQTLQGRVSRGDALQQQEMAKASLARSKARLRAVIGAINRIDEDEYGFCVECGNEISVGRLQAVPEASLCIPCIEKSEQR